VAALPTIAHDVGVAWSVCLSHIVPKRRYGR